MSQVLNTLESMGQFLLTWLQYVVEIPPSSRESDQHREYLNQQHNSSDCYHQLAGEDPSSLPSPDSSIVMETQVSTDKQSPSSANASPF
jgi:hypothetical protein